MTLSGQLARWLIERSRSSLAPANLAHTRRHVGDFTAIAIAARDTSALAAQVRNAMAANGEGPPTRAFVLSAYAHILDFDDIHDLGRVHPGSVVVAAALAAASMQPTSHGRLLGAVSAAGELLCRMGLAWKPVGTGPGSDWFLTQLFGYFAGAAAAGLVLGMDEEQLQSALGLAYMQAAGGKEAGFGTGGNARAIYPAFAAMGGVQAALLARAGVVGPPASLDGLAGFFRLYLGMPLSREQTALLLDDGVEAWPETHIKPWPSCRHSHPFVRAASALQQELRQAGRTPASVTVRVNQSAAKLCEPLAQRRRPQTLQDAKYSVPFMVAFCLVHGEPTLLNLGESTLGDEAVLAMASRVEVELSHDDAPGLPHARITVLDDQGRTRVFDAPYQAPAPSTVFERKFHDCLAFAGFDDAGVRSARTLLDAGPDYGCDALVALLALAPRSQPSRS